MTGFNSSEVLWSFAVILIVPLIVRASSAWMVSAAARFGPW